MQIMIAKKNHSLETEIFTKVILFIKLFIICIFYPVFDSKQVGSTYRFCP